MISSVDQTKFPQPIFDREPGYVDLYWKACELASAHVKGQKGLPQSPYMDEGFWDDTIWIWDTCFMALYCKYAPTALPGIESLLNFYAPIHDGALMKVDGAVHSIVMVQHPDNPPLFAWVEWQYFQMTGDTARVKWLLSDKQYLQKHYDWFSGLKRGECFKWARMDVRLKPGPLGFQWGRLASGMDNSPRFGTLFNEKDIFAIDALAQQGLAAKYISQLAEAINDKELAAHYRGEYDRISNLVNKNYWDETDGFYYDLMPDGKTFSKVRTPASFWPVLAGMVSPQRMERMVRYIKDPNELGGKVPWTSVSRSDKMFNSFTGNYWRGSMWLPTAYMGIRALTENGHIDAANESAEAVLKHMYITYRDYTPHTIWECYNPNKAKPARHDFSRVRPDFCGWSALGPISLFIENVIGIHSIDAAHRVVRWRLHQRGRHGIRNLRFGDVTTDLVADGSGQVEVVANHAYTLMINSTSFEIKVGKQLFSIIGV